MCACSGSGVELRLGAPATANALSSGRFDRVVIATGVKARRPAIDGIDHPKAISYPDLLSGRRRAGERVAIIGAGGIGFDVATFLTGHRVVADPTGAASPASQVSLEDYYAEWGIDASNLSAGGLREAAVPTTPRKVWLLQRKAGKPGSTLGQTTGWIHRRALQQRGVIMRGGVEYLRIDDAGLHIRSEQGVAVLDVDSVIICAGQESVTDLVPELAAAGVVPDVIGGALLAAELDAERAIRDGTTVAARL